MAYIQNLSSQGCCNLICAAQMSFKAPWRQHYLFHQADTKWALLLHLLTGKVKGQRSVMFFI